MNKIIISRHPAAIQFIRESAELAADVPVLAEATPADVAGKIVYGNLPLSLASLAAQVVAVEFTNTAPRGQEYGIDAMRAAGAHLARYAVAALPAPAVEIIFNDGRMPRGYSDMLFVGADDLIARFIGDSVPGVCAVAHRESERNGKWSNTYYTLRMAPGAWSLVSQQDWESGDRFHGCTSVAAVVAQFRAAGCTAPESAIVACLEQAMPRNIQRIRTTEAELTELAGGKKKSCSPDSRFRLG